MLVTTGGASAQALPAFTKVIVLGDSLSDTGNIRNRMESKYFIGYPGGDFNYSDGRFTNSSDTDPGSGRYVGVWHEQLARTFLQLPPARNSLDGGLNYAFGGATTKDGSSERTVISNPHPFIGGSSGITIDNMGRQLDRYLNQQTVDPGALYLIWGGGNDLFDDATAGNVSDTSAQVIRLIDRLTAAGARNFLVPNVPPLGGVPLYTDDPDKQLALNRASASYRNGLNNALDAAQASFAQQGIAVTMHRLDVWSLFVRFAANPGAYGFANTGRSIQGESSADVDKYAFWDSIHPTTAAHFQIAQAAARALSGPIPPPARAVNVSSRVAVGEADNVAIGGFIITGNAPKRVLVRGIGASLSNAGVSGALIDPQLRLFDSSGSVIRSNDDWESSQRAEIIAANLAPSDRLESALIETLAPGSYTAILSGVNSSSGVGLVEVYDLEPAADSTLGNLSTRGFVGTGDNVLIGGLAIAQGDNPIMVLRAIGPNLATAGVANALADPVLELFDANGTRIAMNDNW
ncbi:MAG TPA: SGNH/GDSL hydrolase family protein, partial [Chthoniobacterales bacterium]